MNSRTLSRLIPAVLLATGLAVGTAGAQTSAAPTICKDGTTSKTTGRGACSGHGGVDKTAGSKSSATTQPPAGAPAAAPAATPPPASVPSGGSAEKPVSPVTRKSTAAAKPGAGNTDPTGATAKCKDGTYSKSKHHGGTCSRHGGVDQWLDGSK